MGKAGRPPTKKATLSDQEIETLILLASEGVSQKRIAAHLGMSEATMQRKYGEELARGTAEADMNFEKSFYRMAMSGKAPAISIFWAKTRLGYKEEGPANDDDKKPKPLKWRVTQPGERIAKSPDSSDEDEDDS